MNNEIQPSKSGESQGPSAFGRILLKIINPFSVLLFDYKPLALNPWRAALLCVLCPGLGHLYLGQGGILAFYLSAVLAFSAGTYSLFLCWDPTSWLDEVVYRWIILGVIIVVALWLTSVLDAYFRAKRMMVNGWKPTPANRWIAGVLSLLIPGFGQIYSRRFLMGLWCLSLIAFLGYGAWEMLPKHPPEYYAPYISDPMSKPHVYWHEYGKALMLARIVGILWIANVIDALSHCGQQCVLPQAITKHITLGRMAEAWPEFLFAFLYLAFEYLTLAVSQPVRLIQYLKYWPMYESITIIGTLVGIAIIGRKKLADDEKVTVRGLFVIFAVTFFVLIKTDVISPGWLFLALCCVAIPRLVHMAIEKPDAEDLLVKIGLAFMCLLGAAALLLPLSWFWKTVNPDFYAHLVKTRFLYTLAFLFYFILGCVELVKARTKEQPLCR
jgi:hypothetical protein